MTWLLRGVISVPPTRIGVGLSRGGGGFRRAGRSNLNSSYQPRDPLVLSLAWKTDGGDATMLVEAVAGPQATKSSTSRGDSGRVGRV